MSGLREEEADAYLFSANHNILAIVVDRANSPTP